MPELKLDHETSKIRKTMINYLIEIGDRFKLTNTTIHASASYVDLLLASRTLTLEELTFQE